MVVPKKGLAGSSKLIPTRPWYVDFRLTLRDAIVEETLQLGWEVERAPPPHEADFSNFSTVCRIPPLHPSQIQLEHQPATSGRLSTVVGGVQSLFCIGLDRQPAHTHSCGHLE